VPPLFNTNQMAKLKIKIRKFYEKAVLPAFKSADAACADLVAVRIIKNGLFRVWYDCEFGAEIPKGYIGLLLPRSSISKLPLMLSNSVGAIDPDYRGSFQVRFNRTFWGIFSRRKYKVGERIAQLLIMKTESVEYIESKILTETRRGMGGFGSTGK